MEEGEDEEVNTILGIQWNMTNDTLSVAVDEERFKERAKTPRQVVQQQAALYDPIGILAPFILIGRGWTQKLMQGRWGWDLPLPEKVEEGFNKWTDLIAQTKSICIKRAWDKESTVDAEADLDIFVDGSTSGYGAVPQSITLCLIQEYFTFYSCFIMS